MNVDIQKQMYYKNKTKNSAKVKLFCLPIACLEKYW